jgi:hypothetical protein
MDGNQKSRYLLFNASDVRGCVSFTATTFLAQSVKPRLRSPHPSDRDFDLLISDFRVTWIISAENR